MQKQENSSMLIFSHPVLRRIDVRFSDKLSRADKYVGDSYYAVSMSARGYPLNASFISWWCRHSELLVE